MFLNKKSLIIANQRRVKNHLKVLQKEMFKEVENVVNNEELTLEQQDSENNEVFKKAYVQELKKELDFWSK